MNLPKNIFIEISSKGVNISSEQIERGSVFVEKSNIKNIVDKISVSKSIVSHSVYLEGYSLIMLPSQNYKKVIYLFFMINYQEDILYIIQSAKNILKID